MARSFTNASSSILQSQGTGSIGVSNYPITIAAWVNFNTLPGTISVSATILQIDSSNFASFANSISIGANTSNELNGFLADSTGAFNSSVNVPGTISANTWYPVVYVLTSSTSHTIYGVVGGSFTSGSDSISCVFTGGTFNSGNIAGFRDSATNQLATDDASIADCAVWNVALTSLEAQAFCNGARPCTIRPGALVNWWPLDGIVVPEPDIGSLLRANVTTSGAGTTPGIAFGPPFMQFTPRWPQFNTIIASSIFYVHNEFSDDILVREINRPVMIPYR